MLRSTFGSVLAKDVDRIFPAYLSRQRARVDLFCEWGLPFNRLRCVVGPCSEVGLGLQPRDSGSNPMSWQSSSLLAVTWSRSVPS
ncbi:hypothetical protein P12x_001432 [Tundrisphaera lichenicola]|uniref:hypothetical protein n=1 Tax=Tundrisphaera lichenicola TaxID=2029860 RepID=UPI003EB764FC